MMNYYPVQGFSDYEINQEGQIRKRETKAAVSPSCGKY